MLADQPFDVLVPGHGRPMKRAAFDRYRAAFGALVDCGASDAPAAQCIDGWLAGVGDLVPESDQAYARSLLEYYLAQSLRGDAERVSRLCKQQS